VNIKTEIIQTNHTFFCPSVKMKSIVLCCILGLSALSDQSASVRYEFISLESHQFHSRRLNNFIEFPFQVLKEELPECPFPATEYPVFHPDPTNCNQYYECSNGVPILMKCEQGLVWDPVLVRCSFDYPGNPNPCKGQFQF
jgi:hypothetical protein